MYNVKYWKVCTYECNGESIVGKNSRDCDKKWHFIHIIK